MDSYKKTAHSDRSANFDDAEVKLLLDLVIRFKSVILNRNTNANTNLAKEKIWRQITKLFNKEKINVHRSSDHLKTKWLNLKREARRIQNNSPSEMNDVQKQVIQLSYESVNDPSLQIEISEQDLYEESETKELLNENTHKLLDDDKASSCHSDVDDEKPLKERDRCYMKRNGIRKKSMNFSAQECSLLLKLVKEEKHNLFMAGMSKEVIRKKYLAWERVAKRFNAVSWKKRPVQVLKTKLENMRRLNRHKISLSTSNTEHEEKELSVKTEPSVEYNVDCSEFSQSVDEDRINERASSPILNDMDPLRFVLNSDSGLGINWSTSICSQNDTDLIKLKMELINYQLETAKLERKRVEDAVRADKEEQESRAIENSLRLRTARLKALAAERELNEDDRNGLGYTEQEILAMEYLKMSTNVS
ncbi:uncharacterized protein LOC123712536 isoform X2 [Pieris brassicae]|uniref:uncharacterized protein LOC123712536 isoform X2 n=1 Tax=Pieris brassicae TaxID=7116 RepID=UPI001E65ECEA|nr:uncharacterized protein LOC123712536 isoform X2 [Pieris brassicae]